MIEYAKQSNKTTLENHLETIQNGREAKSENVPPVNVHRSCQKNMWNDIYKEAREKDERCDGWSD